MYQHQLDEVISDIFISPFEWIPAHQHSIGESERVSLVMSEHHSSPSTCTCVHSCVSLGLIRELVLLQVSINADLTIDKYVELTKVNVDIMPFSHSHT